MKRFIVPPSIVPKEDNQITFDAHYLLYRGYECLPTIKHIQVSDNWFIEEEDDEEDDVTETEKTDKDKCEHDLIQGLIRTNILDRFLYILKELQPQSSGVITGILDILCHMASHSTTSATCYE